jgi:hypothetical protein
MAQTENTVSVYVTDDPTDVALARLHEAISEYTRARGFAPAHTLPRLLQDHQWLTQRVALLETEVALLRWTALAAKRPPEPTDGGPMYLELGKTSTSELVLLRAMYTTGATRTWLGPAELRVSDYEPRGYTHWRYVYRPSDIDYRVERGASELLRQWRALRAAEATGGS